MLAPRPGKQILQLKDFNSSECKCTALMIVHLVWQFSPANNSAVTSH